MVDDLADMLSRQATGTAAIIDGVLDVRTVGMGPNHSALLALQLHGLQPFPVCLDSECDCLVRALARMRPAVRIVQVDVRAV